MILKPFKARVLTELIKEGEDREESQGGPSRGDRMMENEIGGMAEEYNILEVNWREYFNKEGIIGCTRCCQEASGHEV